MRLDQMHVTWPIEKGVTGASALIDTRYCRPPFQPQFIFEPPARSKSSIDLNNHESYVVKCLRISDRLFSLPKMWEVDPETKTKVTPLPPLPSFQSILSGLTPYQLAALQKRPGNTTCIDCSAPSPQWASPKFGTFICLTCAGLHRGLGVHISFVRSIQMDSFKPAEISRMELGGNSNWKDFWEGATGRKWGTPGQGGAGGDAMAAVGDRYGGDEGEEYKERLGCKVDGRAFTGVPVKERKKVDASTTAAARTASPLLAAGAGPRSQKAQNEDFFARMGNENAARPEGVAPSMGGKYGGFGSEPAASAAAAPLGGGTRPSGLPRVDEFQADPVAALSKGFGWFASTVGKGAKTVNDGWIQPTAQKVVYFPIFLYLPISLPSPSLSPSLLLTLP